VSQRASVEEEEPIVQEEEKTADSPHSSGSEGEEPERANLKRTLKFHSYRFQLQLTHLLSILRSSAFIIAFELCFKCFKCATVGFSFNMELLNFSVFDINDSD
jgi:hypothetical protein